MPYWGTDALVDGNDTELVGTLVGWPGANTPETVVYMHSVQERIVPARSAGFFRTVPNSLRRQPACYCAPFLHSCSCVTGGR